LSTETTLPLVYISRGTARITLRSVHFIATRSRAVGDLNY